MRSFSSRHLLDHAFSGLSYLSIGFMVAALLVILGPIAVRGIGAYCFRGTIEFRLFVLERFHRGSAERIGEELQAARRAREPLYEAMRAFEADLENDPSLRRKLGSDYRQFQTAVRELLGPLPWDPAPLLMRQQYGQTRWDRALVKQRKALYREEWDYSDPSRMGVQVWRPRRVSYQGTRLEPAFDQLELRLADMLRPRWTFYGRFLTDPSFDAHFFGGIWAEVLGTLCLTLGAMLFGVPVGLLSAIYLAEYATEGRLMHLLRIFINTLSGVPSIVFGLFGMAFFIHTLGVTDSKSVLAGSLTLALLILPTLIRASEEAIRAVPAAYREAAFSLGASRWHTVMTVILPAALPGILTGTVISLGRAAGETAPIIFTAAVSMGEPLAGRRLLTMPTPALPWNLYNLSTEHAAVDEIRHVQYGMALTLVALVLALNLAAILLRARVSRKLRG